MKIAVDLPPPLFLSTLTPWAAIEEYALLGSGAPTFSAAASWAVANHGIFIPVAVPWRYPVRRVFWVTGGSANAGTNFDFGIYTADLTRIYSTGPQASSASNNVSQYVTPTEFMLTPGLYYFALSCSNTTGGRASLVVPSSANELRECGCFMQSGVGTLPANATAEAITDNVYPVCGVTLTGSGF